MAIKDIKTRVAVASVLEAAISSDTTTAGAIIDTADFDLGIMFDLVASAYTDGSYTLLIEEGDDSGLSDAAVVPAEYLIGALPVVAAATGSGAVVPTVGLISNKRYVRTSVVSTSTSTGSSVSVRATLGAELKPTA